MREKSWKYWTGVFSTGEWPVDMRVFRTKNVWGDLLYIFLLNTILMEEVIQQVFGFGANKNHSANC